MVLPSRDLEEILHEGSCDIFDVYSALIGPRNRVELTLFFLQEHKVTGSKKLYVSRISRDGGCLFNVFSAVTRSAGYCASFLQHLIA